MQRKVKLDIYMPFRMQNLPLAHARDAAPIRVC
jgi:hypothetical protein